MALTTEKTWLNGYYTDEISLKKMIVHAIYLEKVDSYIYEVNDLRSILLSENIKNIRS